MDLPCSEFVGDGIDALYKRALPSVYPRRRLSMIFMKRGYAFKYNLAFFI